MYKQNLFDKEQLNIDESLLLSNFRRIKIIKDKLRKDCTYMHSRIILIVIAINVLRRFGYVRYHGIIIFQRIFNKNNIFI